MKYRIIQEDEFFYIEKEGLLWGWNRVTSEKCSYGGYYTSDVKFESADAAEHYILYFAEGTPPKPKPNVIKEIEI